MPRVVIDRQNTTWPPSSSDAPNQRWNVAKPPTLVLLSADGRAPAARGPPQSARERHNHKGVCCYGQGDKGKAPMSNWRPTQVPFSLRTQPSFEIISFERSGSALFAAGSSTWPERPPLYASTRLRRSWSACPFEAAIACSTRSFNPPMLNRDSACIDRYSSSEGTYSAITCVRNLKPPHLVLEDDPISDCAFGETDCPDILKATLASSASMIGSKIPPYHVDSCGVVAKSLRPMRSGQKDISEGQGCFGSIGGGPSISA